MSLGIINLLMSIVIITVPFLILYYVIKAAVKHAIDSSEVGMILKEKYNEKHNERR